ncbi:sulfotransferase domain-containing protein [Olleya namhaensis]|uniref:Sulfotransferase domain-containing protein n=1 Tax=Olleya namhaensis TaxID=1144750 RepID=A0A1I3JPF0_9FLAO|nr:sulfotransferase domain-containing protein [Olleya namhaensis]SFI62142.1 Sulfotransferase domain-containing protein [Olleya namhaensis]
MSKPIDFICVGAQKAGTTSLHDILKKHPNIYLPERKEAHFFDIDERFNKGLDWWMETFFQGDKINKKTGVFTPEYLYLKNVPERIENVLGNDLKIIIVLRQPVKRAYSHYLMSKRRGFETEDFKTALEKEPARLKEGTYYNNNHFSYIDRGLYYNQIKRYVDTFGKENVKVFLFEKDIIKNNDATLKTIQEFIDVPYKELESATKSNQASEPKLKWLRNIIFNKNNPVKKLLGYLPLSDDFKFKIASKINTINQKPAEAEKLTPQEISQLTNTCFLDDIEKVEQLLNIDLSLWK